MWIDSLSPGQARSVLGPHWRDIVRMTVDAAQGRTPARPDLLTPVDYDGARFQYGPNGGSVHLFLKSWQTLHQPGNFLACPTGDVIKVADHSRLPDAMKSPRWRQAMLTAGYQNRGDVLANVWLTGMKVGLEVENHVTRFLAAASAGELAQAPQRELHFFLDMMPWVRSGQLPCNWDAATDRLVVEWFDPQKAADYAASRSAWTPEATLWPTWAMGMRVRDEEAIWRTATETATIIIVRDASPAMPQYIGKPGYTARPPGLPGFVRLEPPHVGLIAAGEGQTAPDGFSIDNDAGRLIRDSAGNTFFEGFELMGVYRLEDGVNVYTEAIRRELNCRLGAELFQTGPYECLAEIEKSRRPRPPVTAFFPDRAPVRLLTVAEMKGVYEAFSINWDGVYPEDVTAEVPA